MGRLQLSSVSSLINAPYSYFIRLSSLRLKHITEGNMKGRIEVTGRRGRRHKQLLVDHKETRGYWKFKEESLGRTLWRTRFGRGYGPVGRQTTE
jgi:hypothetical protein